MLSGSQTEGDQKMKWGGGGSTIATTRMDVAEGWQPSAGGWWVTPGRRHALRRDDLPGGQVLISDDL